MAKKLDFDKEKNNRNDNVIEEIMQADFPLPKQAEDAKNEAFSRIREMAAASGHTENTENMVQRLQEKSTEKSTGGSGKKSTGTAKSHKKFKTVYKTALGLTAAQLYFQQYVSQIRHLQRTSLWLEMYLSSSVIPWDFMVIIRNMQSS